MTVLLLVEDDMELAAAAVRALTLDGFSVRHAADLTSATNLVGEGADRADICLLDLGLPDTTGYQACATMLTTGIPIVVATARDAEMDRVVCLELGADDYVIKPYLMRELGARLRAVLRRTARTTADPNPTAPMTPERTRAHHETEDLDNQILSAGEVSLDRRTCVVTVDGAVVELTAKEFDLLAVLMSDPGRMWRRQDLLDTIWGDDFVGSGRTLDTHVTTLRKKLGRPDMIVARRGIGYTLQDDA